MRKLLLGLLAVILLAFSVYVAFYGVSFAGLTVSGIPTIKEENAKLEKKIESANTLKDTDYPKSVKSLEDAYKKLMTQKDNYDQIISLGVDENGQSLNKIQQYETERLWISLGNYAKKEGIDLNMAVTSANKVNSTYDLNFTVTGGYIQITDFLYDIESDTTLVFKIENFKLVPGTSTESLVATFTWKDVRLNKVQSTDSTTTDSTDSSNSSSKNNTTGNTTSTNSSKNTTSNSIKSTNTTNTTNNT